MLYLRRGQILAAWCALIVVLSGPLPVPFSAGRLASQAHAGVRATAAPNSTIDLADLEKQFAAIAERVAPSVVAISAACDPVDADDVSRSEDLNPDRLEKHLSRATRTVGTGFVIDATGYIATNEHVIAGCEQIWVTTDDRKVYPAIVVGSDPRHDLAVLKIPAAGLTPVTYADPKAIRRGQWTIALGNPYGIATEGEMAMSVGVVSATDRSLNKLSAKENRLYTGLLQTTAEINPGNSGGPLFDLSGNVIGINTAVVLPQKQTNGIGFAIPVSDNTLQLIQTLRQGLEVVHGYLGVVTSTPTARDRRAAGVQQAIGARIEVIEVGSPASGTALRSGDVVVSLNGQTVTDDDHFIRLISQTAVDKPAALKVYRAGQPLTVDVTPRRRPMPSVAVNQHNQRLRWRGMVLAPVPTNWTGSESKAASTDGTIPQPGLMVIGLDESSPYAKTVSLGSIITSVGGQAVHTIAELQSIIEGTLPEKLNIQTLNTATVASINE